MGLEGSESQAFSLAASVLFVESVFYISVLPLLPIYAERYDLSEVGAGLLVGAYAAGVIVGSLLAAPLGRKVGFRFLAAVGLFTLAVTTAIFGFGGSIVVLDGARFLQGVAGGLSWVGALGWVASVTPDGRRGTVMGIVMSAAVLGSILGPVVGAIAVASSTALVFGILAGIQAFLVAAIMLVDVPSSGSASSDGQGPGRSRARPIGLAMSFIALPALLVGVYEVLTPFRLDEAGASTGMIAGVFVVGAAGEAIAGPLAGRYSDRAGRVRPIRIALTAAPLLCLALTMADSQVLLIAIAVVAWVTITSAWSPGLAFVADLSRGDPRSASSHWALMNLVLASGVLVGSTLGPALAASWGDGAPYLLIGAGCGWAVISAGRKSAVPDHSMV